MKKMTKEEFQIYVKSIALFNTAAQAVYEEKQEFVSVIREHDPILADLYDQHSRVALDIYDYVFSKLEVAK